MGRENFVELVEIENFQTDDTLSMKWKIEGIASLRSYANFQSPMFSFKGKEWRLNMIYSDDYGEDYYSAEVALEKSHSKDVFSQQTTVYVNFRGYLDSEKTHFVDLQDGIWEWKEFAIQEELVQLYERDGQVVIGLTFQPRRIGSNISTLPITLKLYENSTNGDFKIKCKNEEYVTADRVVLVNDPFFNSLLHFKSCQSIKESSDQSPNPKKQRIDTDKFDVLHADLSEFSAESVNHLVEFIYTGSTCVPTTVSKRVALHTLADYVNNDALCAYIERAVRELDLSYFGVMDLLISLRQTPCKLRKLAVKYYSIHRSTIQNSYDFNKKRDLLIQEGVDLEFVKSLI